MWKDVQLELLSQPLGLWHSQQWTIVKWILVTTKAMTLRLIFLLCKIEILNILYFILAQTSYNLVAFNIWHLFMVRGTHSASNVELEPLESGFPGISVVKKLPANEEDTSFDSCIRKIPWRRKQPPTPAFLPGRSHGQRSLVGYSPWGCKESDMTEWLSIH